LENRIVKNVMAVVVAVALVGLGVYYGPVSAEDGDKKLDIFKQDIKPIEPLIPPGVKMETKFAPGVKVQS